MQRQDDFQGNIPGLRNLEAKGRSPNSSDINDDEDDGLILG